MLQQAGHYWDSAVIGLGYICAITTGLQGLVYLAKASDKPVGHAIISCAIDVAKLYRAMASMKGGDQ